MQGLNVHKKTISYCVKDASGHVYAEGSRTRFDADRWDAAAAELRATRGKALQTENQVAVKVHQLYYRILERGDCRAQAQLAQAEENLARVKEEIEVRVQTAYNKLERTHQMINVSNELLTLRKESWRVFAQQLQEGAALRSQAGTAAARETGR